LAVNSLAVLEKTINRELLLKKAKEVGELAEKLAAQADQDAPNQGDCPHRWIL